MKKFCFFLLRLYKKFISPSLPQKCIYTPTCSMYMYDAIERYGVIRGVPMGLWRIMRCNRFSKGGYDPVKENLRGNAKWTL